ncbi:hypothetical protein FVEG_03256 [Fusarium verticillioides 7600]|uniref:Heterokaryon incompatibility domain-containing protein n=1 Tax=Gibberella moniliformis (strain M3125 / FGSC 7600) TaxID=334819 RepID=W7LRB2_GIBM7|nr:hypothetical protein FVEG_03256 [Fusarium verticillioides 7600]EWG41081.1 hypothetical protein FVEG_03256 [Fusarium verticillioides 7600]
MSCFPYPRDTDVESIRVPLIARTQYSITDQTNCSDSFKRAACDATTQMFNAAESDHQESTSFSLSHWRASVIQSWLFFRLASEALGRNIRHEEFAGAQPDGSHSSIDLRIPQWYWRELKARWDELNNSLTAAELEAKRTELKKVYQSAQIVLIYIDNVANLDDDKLTEILLSVHMLSYLVAYVLDSDTLKVAKTSTMSASTKLLKRRMIKNGWCEKRLNFLDASPMSYPEFYFISSLKPPRINSEDHSGCSSDKCLVTNKLSMPLHRTDGCLCEDIVVPVERVKTIVASGGIPVVRITQSPLGKIELEVVPYTPSCRFIAISHVWGDQQFGSSQNCLPKCQVEYLRQVLSSLPTSIEDWGLREWIANWWSFRPGEIEPPSRAYEYFWLDSFCIPQAIDDADLRGGAIESMNLIYAAASHTLVFDKGLQALNAGRRPASIAAYGRPTYYSPQDEDLLDVVAYIYASNWMGRAWTLQEGILSGCIVFPLHGSLAYLKLLRPSYDGSPGNKPTTEIKFFECQRVPRLRANAG